MQSASLALEPVVEKYLDAVSVMSKSTSDTYRYRLYPFRDYVGKKHRISIQELIASIQSNKLDVYDILANYAAYLQQQANAKDGRGRISIKRRVNVVKLLFAFHDVEISELKFKTKVKLPKNVTQEKAPIDKQDVRKILLTIEDPRLKTYVMLLASTGMRAREATHLKFENFDFKSEPPRVTVPGQYTKTRMDRTRYLTKEFVKQFEDYSAWRHRERRISYYITESGHPRSTDVVYKPEYLESDLVFSIPHRDRKNNADGESLYREFLTAMNAVVDRIGLGKRESHSGFRQITRHTFRRFVKSVISDLGYGDYSEWFIGHEASTYYRRKESERIELFKKIAPYLTFLDFSELEARGADMDTKIQRLESENRDLRQSVSKQIDEAVLKVREEKALETQRFLSELVKAEIAKLTGYRARKPKII